MKSLSESEDLWDKYCSFYDRGFDEQLESNREQLRKHLSAWSQTATATLLKCKGLEDFNQVPGTVYSDYPFLDSFGKDVEAAVKATPKTGNESNYRYYGRIAEGLSNRIQQYLPGTLAAWAKTTGTTGSSKSLVWSSSLIENLELNFVAAAVLACSYSWGETKLRKGDTFLNIVAPVPYMSGYIAEFFQRHFRICPPVSVTDNIPDMRRRFYIALDLIEKGTRIDVAGGVASTFHLVCRYFSERQRFFREYYESMGISRAKLYFLYKWIGAVISRSQKTDLKSLFPVKGMPLFGVDATHYSGYFKDIFGLEPTNVFGSTELGVSMFSPPDKKHLLMPNLRGAYLEFLNEHGDILDIDEVKRSDLYTLVGTPFGSPLIRYNSGDMFRVDTFRDDGMPLFTFEGRTNDFVELYGYVRITEALAVECMRKAGMGNSDRWVITKLTEQNEHFGVLMEKEWEYDDKEAEERIFKGLLDTTIYMGNYVKDFNIKRAEQVVTVQYLRKGAFLRYMLHRTRAGAPLGQMKPPKIIPVNRMDIYEMLRSI